MKKLAVACLIAIIAFSFTAKAQNYFHVNKDSSGFVLTAEGASLLASLPLKCIDQEYPNKTSHTSLSDSDHLLTPKQLHPAFYGCFDWHSCVHGHWMLVRLLKLFPNLPEAAAIRKAIHQTINAQNIATEVKYFDGPVSKTWERTYGWAWLLKLDEELLNWNDADGKQWHTALQPLTKKIVDFWVAYMPKQTYPNRTGVHPNTAFGLVFALDYARAAKNKTFENSIVTHAKKLFLKDREAPTRWEPDGSDFLSPSLEEADLMRRVLPAAEFNKWFSAFISNKDLQHLTQLPHVSDRTDYQIVHLDGLCLSRSWAMKGIASALPAGDKRKRLLFKSAVEHLSTALPHVAGGNYGGEHWLASFAVYALAN
jgi:hypothetical protein